MLVNIPKHTLQLEPGFSFVSLKLCMAYVIVLLYRIYVSTKHFRDTMVLRPSICPSHDFNKNLPANHIVF